MKLSNETEEQFTARFHEWKRKGMCLFRNDINREFILDLMYDYMDIVDALNIREVSINGRS